MRASAANRVTEQPQHPIPPDRAARLSEVLRAVAHPLRLRIIALLCREETHVGALAAALEAEQAIVSQQLRILRMSRLVDVTRTGGQARYRLAEPHLRELLRCLESCDHA